MKEKERWKEKVDDCVGCALQRGADRVKADTTRKSRLQMCDRKLLGRVAVPNTFTRWADTKRMATEQDDL